MKTILHVSKYYYPVLGGIENTAKQIVDGLSQYSNVVICYSSDKENHKEVINGVTVYRIGVIFSISSQDFALRYGHYLSEIIREYIPDYIHVHCPNPFVYPFICKYAPQNAKIILHWHSDILGKGILYNIVKPIETKILRRANRILVTSPNYAEGSETIKPFIDKVRILQSSINVDNLNIKHSDENEILDIKNRYGNRKLIFVFGRHVPYKGIDMLIQSEKYIKSDVQIVIGGSGPMTQKLKQIAKNNTRIVFVGRLSDDELRAYLWASDIFGFTSNTKAEAFGLALAEAMYCGCVPVTFKIEGSGVNWVSLKDVTGKEVELANVKEYAKAIDELLENEPLYKQFSVAAHNRVMQMFTVNKMIKTAINIYNEL